MCVDIAKCGGFCEVSRPQLVSRPLPNSPYFAAPPEDPNELVKYVSPRKPLTTNPDNTILDCEDMSAAYDAMKEPTASELPALLEKHASRLAEMRHYDSAADVQLASERLVAAMDRVEELEAAVRAVADQAGAKICALEAEIKRLLSSPSRIRELERELAELAKHADYLNSRLVALDDEKTDE